MVVLLLRHQLPLEAVEAVLRLRTSQKKRKKRRRNQMRIWASVSLISAEKLNVVVFGFNAIKTGLDHHSHQEIACTIILLKQTSMAYFLCHCKTVVSRVG